MLIGRLSLLTLCYRMTRVQKVELFMIFKSGFIPFTCAVLYLDWRGVFAVLLFFFLLLQLYSDKLCRPPTFVYLL